MKARFVRGFQQMIFIASENIGLKILSILLAGILFGFSRETTIDVRVSEIPVEFRDVPLGHEIVEAESPTVSVRLRGPEGLVRGLTASQVSVVADLRNKEAGLRIVPLHPENVIRPDRVEVLEIVPRNIALHIERTATRVVPVRVRTEGRVAEGSEIYDIRAIPPTIEIEGPDSVIAKTSEVVTETVNLAGREGRFETQVDLETPAPSLRIRRNERIRLAIGIGQRRVTRLLRGIAVVWPERGERDLLQTREVDLEIFGPEAMVGSVRPEEVEVRISTGGQPGEVKSLRPTVTLPRRVSREVTVTKVLPEQIRFRQATQK